MPEMPEVETVRRSLEPFVLNQTIEKVHVFRNDMVLRNDVHAFQARLKNQTIQEIKRRGKYLLFICDDVILISHLRMEGKYYVEKISAPKMKHEHVRFDLTNQTALIYHDVRTFGTFEVVNKTDITQIEPLKKLGLEPFDEGFNQTYLKKAFEKRNGPIKSVLLDQTIILGLGNIYADEVLFCAKINPTKKASKIGLNRLKTLSQCIQSIIKEAIVQGGTTIRTYHNVLGIDGLFQTSLKVHLKKDEPCQRCQTSIEKIKINGRSTYYCPSCQRG